MMETKKEIKTLSQKKLESLELAKQVDEFLLNGGKIKEVEPTTRNYKEGINGHDTRKN